MSGAYDRKETEMKSNAVKSNVDNYDNAYILIQRVVSGDYIIYLIMEGAYLFREWY